MPGLVGIREASRIPRPPISAFEMNRGVGQGRDSIDGMWNRSTSGLTDPCQCKPGSVRLCRILQTPAPKPGSLHLWPCRILQDWALWLTPVCSDPRLLNPDKLAVARTFIPCAFFGFVRVSGWPDGRGCSSKSLAENKNTRPSDVKTTWAYLVPRLVPPRDVVALGPGHRADLTFRPARMWHASANWSRRARRDSARTALPAAADRSTSAAEAAAPRWPGESRVRLRPWSRPLDALGRLAECGGGGGGGGATGRPAAAPSALQGPRLCSEPRRGWAGPAPTFGAAWGPAG
ncbi:unnamed protein product, partial [Prorocentrum cordatum]